MKPIEKLYKKGNYTVQKSINFEDKLYTRLKEIVETKYEATISEVINICVEDLIERNNIKYYARPAGEIVIYRSVMIRKENVEKLEKITKATGISVTRLINTSIKEFLDLYWSDE